MLIDCSLLILISEVLHVCLHEDVYKGFKEVEKEPIIYHFDIGCPREVITDADEHSSKDKHDRDIERDDRFKKEFLEVVGSVTNKVQNDGWDEAG